MDLSPDEDHFQGRLLHQAALWDNLELVEELLCSGTRAAARDRAERTALHAAALPERSRCLAALARAPGALVDARSDLATGGKTALHIAAERGHVENVKTLVAAGADLAVLDANGDTALALAEKNNHRHAANALRDARDAVERARLAQHAQLRELLAAGDVAQLAAKLQALGNEAGLVANLTPGGASTLLYVACESGLAGAVAALVEGGADGRAHPVTKYGPLYAAAYHGHEHIARLLLRHFPSAVQQETVERWLPLHAASIGGHAALVALLLDYPYPDSVLSTYTHTDARGRWQYRAPFDVNAVDVSGQSALHIACTLGNVRVATALLRHTVPCQPQGDAAAPPSAAAAPAPAPLPPARAQQVLSPSRSGISLGIHAIVTKLTGGASNRGASDKEAESGARRVCPVRVDTGAERGADTCVACCARGEHVALLALLLAHGAPAHAHAAPPHQSERDGRLRARSASAGGRASPAPTRKHSDAEREGPWTALALACRARNVQIAEMLLNHGAIDPHCRAIRECARNGLTELMAKILATKAYPDPEHKLDRSGVAERVFARKPGDAALTYSALCPTTPVLVNWRGLNAQLHTIRMPWLRLACVHVNRRLSSDSGALHALTRLDLSNNELRHLPPQLFTLLSVRYINAAQNKLERLPSPGDPLDEDVDTRRGKKVTKNCYTAPALQELYLQDNRLEELPPALFSLPALATLDVSNNKLRALPPRLWAAPCLRDLNAALNHLKDLPAGEVSDSSPAASVPSPVSAAPLTGAPHFNVPSTWSSRSPSMERSGTETGAGAGDGDECAPAMADRHGNAVVSAARRVHSWRGVVEPPSPPAARGTSPLQSLNLAHNQFSCLPSVLACRAASLTRLNMAYNSLRSMSYVTSYPTSLRQLDLSHNEITCWPSLPQVEHFGPLAESPLLCYCPSPSPAPSPGVGGGGRPRSGGSVRDQLLNAACSARRHLRLEGLRTLILANNLLTRIQLTTDDDGYASDAAHEDSAADEDEDWGGGRSLKGKLLFPLLSMLDVSCNMLRIVPPHIHRLTNLSVLNVSGNKEITDLPPQMGLLSRLWSLSAGGCSLGEPLRGMVCGGKCKSADIVGYLKSVLHAATKYARMKLMLVGEQGIGKTSLLECLRQESALQHRRKPTEHWAKRMGNKSSRRNMSTVGVDIGTWVYEKSRSTRGPITFRTWDFGGQQEYYATHQYFLSRRALYLVLWKVTDGKRGLATALDWLRSIQGRAPGSPCILVATHYDQVSHCNLPESESPETLQRLIRTSIMGAPDADKLGLPRVMDSLEISCSTRHNVRLLADIVYSVAFSVKPPGSKEPLLEQRIPATYLALEECVTSLAAELPVPVVRHAEYRRLVSQYMQQKNHKMFRDAAELHQATMFLHENGVLVHYDDATLKELYFLRPQWLCDLLAHVLTVREINPFAAQGIMKVEDLAHVFKASPLLWGPGGGGGTGEELGVSLLNKFELALSWEPRVLLVPSLLPALEPALPQLSIRSRGWAGAGPGVGGGTPRRVFPAYPHFTTLPDSTRGSDSPTLVEEGAGSITIEGRGGSCPLRRVLVVTYVPCGFWARLCTRLLADAALSRLPLHVYTAPTQMEPDDSISKALELNWGWKLWRCGMKLVCGALTLVSLREVPPKYDALLGTGPGDEVERDLCVGKFRVQQEGEGAGSGAWYEVEAQRSACIELVLPAQVAVARREDRRPIAGYQSISLEPNPEVLARVLALVSEHVDLLLEDWYPSLGTRFVHTSEGRCLITRLVPCPACLRDAHQQLHPHPHPHQDRREYHDALAQQAFRRLELGGGGPAPGLEPRPRPRLSADSRASDGDSGVGADSNASSRVGSVEGVGEGGCAGGAPGAPVGYAWTVEQCILSACTSEPLHCPHHAHVSLRDVAPDTLLLDIEEEKRARWEHITRTSIVGRGAFGTVLTATWRPPAARAAAASAAGAAPADGEGVKVALKALQPVPPPPNSDLQAQHAYKAAASRWSREPSAAACRAYCGLRQELSILAQVRHAHVVPWLAVCAAPLALLLALAPMGALEGLVREYGRCGARAGERCARALLLQVARALEYLHDRRILYRDLKSENVLVWRMPKPAEAAAAEARPAPLDVHVKLGDYGISRLAPPSGTKGFGGTEGFMAPEIMRYNGEEEYNEKVDCFSFGMLVYEVVTCRQPFEGHEAVKEAILEGARPSLTPRELEYPWCVLEAMRRCWAGWPELRPSAAALVSALAAPECTTLRDAAHARPAAAAASTHIYFTEEGGGEGGWGWEVWYGGGEPERVHAAGANRAHFTLHHSVRVPPDKAEPVMVSAVCRVGAAMWVGDSAGRLSVYSSSSCALLWSIKIQEMVGGAPSGVSALQPLPGIQRVALALTCGRLFLVRSHRPEPEGIFVLTELGTATELCCLSAAATDQGFEVWAGGADLCAYSVSAEGVSSADTVPAPGPAPGGRVTALAAGGSVVVGYYSPGVCVYQWAAGGGGGGGREVRARLDCSKLAPCSESLQSIAIDDLLTEDRCRVSALCVWEGCVYVGTAWGCLIVCDATTLRPLTVFRPYEADLRVIVPLAAHRDGEGGSGSGSMLVTFGSGYRPLLQRFAPIQTSSASNQHSGHYCLLWRPGHWLPD